MLVYVLCSYREYMKTDSICIRDLTVAPQSARRARETAIVTVLNSKMKHTPRLIFRRYVDTYVTVYTYMHMYMHTYYILSTNLRQIGGESESIAGVPPV